MSNETQNSVPRYLSTPERIASELDSIRDRLMTRGIVSGERLYGCDEWSEPVVRLQKVIEALQATAPPRVVDVALIKDAIEQAHYVGLMIGADCAAALADLQESGIYKPRCSDGKPSNADARKDYERIKQVATVTKNALISLEQTK